MTWPHSCSISLTTTGTDTASWLSSSCQIIFLPGSLASNLQWELPDVHLVIMFIKQKKNTSAENTTRFMINPTVLSATQLGRSVRFQSFRCMLVLHVCLLALGLSIFCHRHSAPLAKSPHPWQNTGLGWKEYIGVQQSSVSRISGIRFLFSTDQCCTKTGRSISKK